jgi:hypothetical protein
MTLCTLHANLAREWEESDLLVFRLATRKTTQGLGASTLRQIPKEETQGCGGHAERQLDPGSKPPFGLHDGSLLGIHHVVDPHR